MRSKQSPANLVYFVHFGFAKIQSSVSLRLTAPFKRSLGPLRRGRGFREANGVEFLPRDKKQRPHSTRLRNEPTPAEERLWYGFLRTASPQWNRQRVIGSYIVDFFCLKAKLVIELDGSQHYDENGLIEYDKIRTDYLEALELRVLRFTNSEIENSFADVCQRIQFEVEQRVKI